MFIKTENGDYINLDHIVKIAINTDDASNVRVYSHDVRNAMTFLYRVPYGPTEADKQKTLKKVRENIEQLLFAYQYLKKG